MKKLKKMLIVAGVIFVLVGIAGAALYYAIPHLPYGFARALPEEEQQLRLEAVSTAAGYLGAQEGDAVHKQIIDLYNSHEPLAQGYAVTYTDNWCATFASAVAIQCGNTDIVPTECGCERQIALFQELNRWEESDTYLPSPGDYIFYAWDEFSFGDCTGWADHVGIVAGTWGPFIQVIEGNKDDAVGYRYIWRWDFSIRGYGLPDYASK